MLLILISGFLFSCGTVDPENTEDPKDLTMDLTVADDGSGLVSIRANAVNAVDYQLYIDSGVDPVDNNGNGIFEYTFGRTGIYKIEIRAFGNSGRFIRESRQVEVVVGNGTSIEDGYVSATSYLGFNLVWNDEFDGNSVKSENWSFETGDGCPNCGWGNNELQYYRSENAWVKDGVLTIEARQEKFEKSDYTSARIVSKNLRSFKYGRIDIRALLPQGQGIWPALWMLGSNISSVGWPGCGEIDIMEMVGGVEGDNKTHGTVHWEFGGERVLSGGSYTLPEGILADEYHVFSILWDEVSIKWYLNDVEFYSVAITDENMSELHKDFFFIFNVAVGGNWPGNPDSNTYFPQRMLVDYVRVFQK